MKNFFYVSIFSMFMLFACQPSQEMQPLSQEEMVQKGEYLVMIGGCNDCHTPKNQTPQGPVPNMSLLLSGHPHDSELPKLDPASVGPGKWIMTDDNLTAWVGPWGMSFTANLTPDEQTGIGLWEEENFVNAMRTGKHMGLGRPIMPPMPWFNLQHAKDEDLKAMFSYLKSLKPISNLVPAAILPDELSKM